MSSQAHLVFSGLWTDSGSRQAELHALHFPLPMHPSRRLLRPDEDDRSEETAARSLGYGTLFTLLQIRGRIRKAS